jgi:coenzyme F420-dependent glucose-6-phosphate dehydrogenase
VDSRDRQIKLGYSLSSEEQTPAALVDNARMAEQAGFGFALISDHYHPWTDRQGQSAFVWSVLGAIARATESITLGTGVTCPSVRLHPAIVAQASATVASLMPGRFFLGLGTGENLNEHILGDRWPSLDVRQEMLEEAVDVIRLLWSGGLRSHRGQYFEVENARIYSLPPEPPPIYIAAAGPDSARLAGRIGDGLISVAPLGEVVQEFTRGERAGRERPRLGQVTVCWAESEAEARRTAFEYWPTAAIHGAASQELPLPSHFEELARSVNEDQVAERVVCGPDPQRHIDQIRKYGEAGFDHVFIHQVGPDQEGFMRFAQQELLPVFATDRELSAAASGTGTSSGSSTDGA